MKSKARQGFDKIYMTLWLALFRVVCALAKIDRFESATRLLVRFLAWQSLVIKRGKEKSTLEQVVLEWQRMFPSKEINHIKSIEKDTVYAEVRVLCPLRGSGNVAACYRAMGYDRAMLRKIGGQLIVLRSQAEPGVEVCEVALRMKTANINDLVAAHHR